MSAATSDPIAASDAIDEDENEAERSNNAEASEKDPFDVNGADDNKFQKAISSWRNINLTKLIPSLDTTASDLVSQQRDALVERKDLAQKTKDFRRLDDQGKLTEVKGLLKAYQTYIDLITNHNKTVSSSFLSVYSSLSEAPDPYPLLEASVESLVVADEIVPRLEEENRHLLSTNSKLASQLEEAERKLEEERSHRQQLEETRETKVKEVEESWAEVLSEKENNWQARERVLEERAENQERLLKELKASYEVSQRLEKSEANENGANQGSASAVELEIVSADLERAYARVAEIEARNEQLRVQLAQSATNSSSSQKSANVEDDPAYLRLRSENSSLLRKVETTRYERDAEKRSLENNLRSLRKEVAALKEDSENLRVKVQQWSDYDDVKRELEVLKSIEFSTGDQEEIIDAEAAAGGASQSSVSKDGGQNLEQLLMARNKKLNNELTVLRVSHQDLASRLETLQDELSTANMELEKSRNLNVTLENDLSKMQQEAQNPGPAMSTVGTYTSRYPASTARRGGRASPTSSIISGFDNASVLNAGSLDAMRAGEPVGGGSGMLPMIIAQRDRFKKRNAELESELSKTHQSVSSLRSEVAGLQKDNLNLYEKTRYVNTYSRSGAGNASYTGASPNPSSINMGSDNAQPLDRYRSAYESRISPFAQFRGRESARAFKRMSLPERIIYQVTKLVLATRTSRNLFALYCLALHLLVLGMLYFTSSVEIEKHNTHLADGVAAAVVAAGPGPARDGQGGVT